MPTAPLLLATALTTLCVSNAANAQFQLRNEWRFDEQSGTTANPTVGTVTGSLAQGAAFSAGAIAFTGQTFPQSSASFGDAVSQFGTDDFAVEFTMKSSQVEVFGSPIEILGNRTTPEYGNFLSVRGAFAGKLAVEICDGIDLVGFQSQANVFDGNWHSLRVERTGTFLSLYVDGALDSTRFGFKPIDIFNSSDLILGNQYVSQSAPTTPFIGQIDDLRIYTVPSPGIAALLALAGFPRRRR